MEGCRGWRRPGRSLLVFSPWSLFLRGRAAIPSPALLVRYGSYGLLRTLGSRGTVRLKARVKQPAVAVVFEVSLDRGRTWATVGIDNDPSKGWSTRWKTLGLNGPARIRASRVGVPPERHAINVHVDNEPPKAHLRTSPHLFSPNGDGRRDLTRLKLRTNEPASVRVPREEGRSNLEAVEAPSAQGSKANDRLARRELPAPPARRPLQPGRLREGSGRAARAACLRKW